MKKLFLFFVATCLTLSATVAQTDVRNATRTAQTNGNGTVNINNSYYLLGSASNSGGGASQTEEFMKTQDFVNLLNNGPKPNSAYKLDDLLVNNGFPIFKWQGGTPIREENIENSNITIYPNPTRGELIIEMGDMGYGICDIAIFDVMGRIVQSSEFNVQSSETRNFKPETLNISGLPAGIYFLRIQTENGVVTKKIIKSEL